MLRWILAVLLFTFIPSYFNSGVCSHIMLLALPKPSPSNLSRSFIESQCFYILMFLHSSHQEVWNTWVYSDLVCLPYYPLTLRENLKGCWLFRPKVLKEVSPFQSHNFITSMSLLSVGSDSIIINTGLGNPDYDTDADNNKDIMNQHKKLHFLLSLLWFKGITFDSAIKNLPFKIGLEWLCVSTHTMEWIVCDIPYVYFQQAGGNSLGRSGSAPTSSM